MANLFTPITVGGIRLRNRLVFPPMQMGKAGEEGEVTEDLIDHYRKYSSSSGLIVVEHSYVLPEGKYSSGQLGIDKDSLISGLESLAEVAKEGGAAAIIQLNYAGLKAGEHALNLLDFDYEGSLTRYSRAELERISESFVEATKRAREAGFDGVEIHGAHGFLLSEFVSSITNDRDDEYGGQLEDRIKFPLRLVKEVREELSDGILSYRLGATDLDPRGFTIDEAKVFAKELDNLGVDILDVSGGLCGSSPDELNDEQGFFVPYAREIGEVTSPPVVGVGGINDPSFANDLIESGEVDFVAVGRAQLRDSTWATRARNSVS
ncbi:MAG: NADH:flavin oxidoreductase [Candidatus Bipolaricaulia bacterium]